MKNILKKHKLYLYIVSGLSLLVLIGGLSTFLVKLKYSVTLGYEGNVISSANLSAVAEDILPSANNTYDIGAYDKAWRNLYVSSTAYIQNLEIADISTSSEANLTTLNISGQINGDTSGTGYVSIGTPGAGTASAIDDLYVAGLLEVAGNLTVAPDTDATTILGRAKIGSVTADESSFAHLDNLTATNFAIRQNAIGETTLNSASARTLHFGIAGIDQFRIDATNGFHANDTNGPAFLKEAASATNPTLIPNRSDLTTGIGGLSETLSFISGGAEIAFATSTGLLAGSNNSLDLGSYDNAWKNIYASSTLFLGGGTDASVDSLNVVGTTTFSGRVSQIGLGGSTYFGYQAGEADDLTANNNVAIGYQALQANKTGSSNVAIGYKASSLGLSFSNNVAIGNSALMRNVSGSNVAIGNSAFRDNVNGNFNVVIGNSVTTLATGNNNRNTFVGSAVMYGLTSAVSNDNTAFGYGAGRYIADGVTANTTANNALYLGNLSRPLASDGTNEIVIGYNAIGKGSNTVVLGNDDITDTWLKGSTSIIASTTALLGYTNGSYNNVADLGAFGSAWKNIYASSTLFVNTVSTTGQIEAGGDIFVNNANGGAILNEASSASNPTLIPNRDDVTSGIGSSGTGNVAIIGGMNINVTTVNAATYDLLATDRILNVTYTGTGAVTSLTLPTAQTLAGRVITIKDAGGNASVNNITVDTEGAENIDGAGTLVMSTDYQSVNLYSDGSNWFKY